MERSSAAEFGDKRKPCTGKFVRETRRTYSEEDSVARKDNTDTPYTVLVET